MFIWTAKLKKGRILLVAALVILLAVLLFVLAGFLHKSTEDGIGRLDTEESRVSYLTSLGWQVNPEPVATLQLQLPDPLAEPFVSYNVLQKKQGFDLTESAGCRVTRYTYTVTNYPGHPDGVQANLYLCEGLPVAGDIMVTGANGFQAGLAFPE